MFMRTAAFMGLVARALGATFGSCVRQTSGGLAVGFTVSLPVVLAAVGMASDYITMTKVRADLQAAADAAAMAGAREILLARSNAAQVKSAAMSYAAYSLVGDGAATKEQLAAANLQVGADVIDDFSAVKVDIAEAWAPFFAHLIKEDITPIRVNATARFVGSNNICVLGLSDKGSPVFVDRYGQLTGNGCGVFSNSRGTAALKVETGAKLETSITCSVGGNSVSASAVVDPSPLSDCPVVPDPLADRPAPAVSSCDHNSMFLTNQTMTLDPGVYCAGLTIDGTSVVTLNPGVYVIKDGQLLVGGTAYLHGEGVSFFITGTTPGKIKFNTNTKIELSAPVSGTMAGILVFEDRTLGTPLKHQISSNNARKLIGTIYLPVGDLIVDASNPVADQSAYTAIIARHLELNAGPNLVLNSDYEATEVPVPEGIKGTSQVVLTQ